MEMQSRATLAVEEGKDPTFVAKSTCPKVLTSRPFKFLLLFLFLSLGISLLTMFPAKYLRLQYQSSVRLDYEEQGNYGLEKWIKPPSQLFHNMTDTELFWRASLVPRIRTYPFKRVPKIAFMFLTKGPLPLSPLWERFFRGHEGLYSIYIHSLPSYVAEFPPTSVFYKRQIPSQVAEWGMMSMCDAERRLLANALLDISNEWFILLSESCIPLHHFSIIYLYISRSRFSFMDSFDDPGPYGRGRYNPNMAPEVNHSNWRKGSQWFELNRNLTLDIVSDSIYYPKFRDFCSGSCYVDEHYFQTMLTVQSPEVLANRSLTWVDWSRGGAHPATFGNDDISAKFFKRLSEGQACIYNGQPSALCFLFARKLAPSALDPLMDLASKVFRF